MFPAAPGASPLYPPLAKAARLSGSVLAKISVDFEGALSAELSGATLLVNYSFALDEVTPAPIESEVFQLRTVTPPSYITCAYVTPVRKHWLRRAAAYFAGGVKRVA